MAWEIDRGFCFNQNVIQRSRHKARIWPFDLKINEVMDIRDDPKRLLRIARKHILVSLVINCHGTPGHAEFGRGVHTGNAKDFNLIKRSFNDIWFSSCDVAGSATGITLCQTIADEANAYVVASPSKQGQTPAPKNHIRRMNNPIYLFKPGSKVSPWKTFSGRPDIPIV